MPNAMIVGASRGLGRALAELYLREGWSVIATARDARALDALDCDALSTAVLEVTDRTQIGDLALRFKDACIDLLFVVAGITLAEEDAISAVSEDDFARIMLVNAWAPLAIVDALAALVPPTGTIAVMTSGLASIASNETGGREAYGMSKAALNMGMRGLAARRAHEGRTYLAVSPGWVRTEMGGDLAPVSVSESVRGIADVIRARQGAGGTAFVAYDGREWAW